MKRREYLEAELEIVKFSAEDIIFTSGGADVPDDEDTDENGWSNYH